MIAKLAIVEEEADESIYWIDLLIESEILPAHRLLELLDELNQIVAITVSSQKTLRRNNPKSKIQNDQLPQEAHRGGERKWPPKTEQAHEFQVLTASTPAGSG